MMYFLLFVLSIRQISSEIKCMSLEVLMQAISQQTTFMNIHLVSKLKPLSIMGFLELKCWKEIYINKEKPGTP